MAVVLNFFIPLSLPIFRRERSDNRKYVCCSQATSVAAWRMTSEFSVYLWHWMYTECTLGDVAQLQ